MAAPLDLLRPVTLHGGWRSHAGDDLRFADPAFDESGWLPDNGDVWQMRADLGGDFVWYRLHLGELILHPGQQLGIAVQIRGASELYVDGKRYGGSGVIGERYGPFGFAYAVIASPPIASGHGVVLAVRVWVDRRWMPSGGLVGDVIIGDAPVVERQARAARDESRVAAIPQLVLALFAIGIGLLYLELQRRRRGLPGALAFAVGALCFGCSDLLQVVVAWEIAVPVWWRVVFVFLLGGGLSGYSVSLAQMFGGSIRWAWGLVSAYAARSVVMAFVPLSKLGFMVHTMAIVVIAVPFFAWWLGTGLRRDLPGGKAIAVGTVAFISTAVLGTLSPPGSLNPIVETLGPLAILIAMSWALAEHVVLGLTELESTYLASLRFVPVEFLERVGRKNFRLVQRGDAVRERMSILFLDVRGFTTLAEANPPEFAFNLVNQLLDHLEPHIRTHRGFITSYTGDGFAALFSDADGAVLAAIAIQKTLDTLAAERTTPITVRAGIGVHTGTVMLGTVGGSTYLTVSVVADAVNLAARVEGTTKLYGARVLITSETRDAMTKPVGLRVVDRVIAKGRREPVLLVQVTDAETAAAAEHLRKGDDAFARARESYFAGRFAEAAEGFASCAEDPTAAVLAARCRELAATPPAGWDGIWRLDHK